MSKSIISELSNAFSTGGGGVNFEQSIQTMFLLTLLVDGFTPVLNEPTVKVCFQAKRIGYAVDDLVVYAGRNKPQRKLLCQIKHSVSISVHNETFKAVINAAWHDFNSDGFDKKRDKIALAVAQISKTSRKSLHNVHSQALSSIDENDFWDRIHQPYYSDSGTRNIVATIKSIIENASGGISPSNLELWEFFGAFVLLVFDLDCVESINKTLAISLINNNTDTNPALVWAKLFEYAAFCNQTGASVDINSFDETISSYFGKKANLALPLPIGEIDANISFMALIGAWNEENKHDRRIIEEVTNTEYTVYEEKVRSLIVKNPEYLQITNGRWKVKNKELLLNQCSSLLFDDTVIRFINAAKKVFSQINKQIISMNSFVMVSNGAYDNSVEIRKSIISSISWIKHNACSLKNCSSDRVIAEIDSFVREILAEGEWTVWASISDCIQDIAELSPMVFMDRLERSVVFGQDEVLKLFPPKKAGVFGQSNYIANVLWALETLAWSPDYLIQAVRILGLLEQLPYERTNWVNTPVNSIASILLPWYPQTMANIDKRKSAVLCLKKENLEVFWEVIWKLLPNQTLSTTGNPRPKYLKVDIPEEIHISYGDLEDQYSFIINLAIEAAENDCEKIASLVEVLEYMDEDALEKYLVQIEELAQHEEEDSLKTIWLRLQNKIDRIQCTENAVLYPQLERIHFIIEKITPKNICLKYQELFSRDKFFGDADYIQSMNKIDKEKDQAIKEIFDKYSPKAVESFANAVHSKYEVAIKLGRNCSDKEISIIINAYHKGNITKQFLTDCIVGFVQVAGPESLLDTAIVDCENNLKVDILASITFTINLLPVVEKLLDNEVEYWEKAILPFGFSAENGDELRLTVDKLKACRRFVDAINLIGNSIFEFVFNGEELCELMRIAGTEESVGEEKIDTYAVRKLIQWLYTQDAVDIDSISNIEWIYLPVLKACEEAPRALNTKLSSDPQFFCSLIEQYYRKSKSPEKPRKIYAKGLYERLLIVLVQFKVVPGINSEGHFEPKLFKSWLDYVEDWSEKQDRYNVTMQTVGTGMSYAPEEPNGLLHNVMIEELNRANHTELRRGYFLGTVNQRGVHFVDPEGKPEIELAKQYKKKAEKAETLGFSRYAELLRDIENFYVQEAKQNIQRAQYNQDE